MKYVPTQAGFWKQAGRISLWRYTEHERNFRGWHLNADAVGCQSLSLLIESLLIDGAGHRTVDITAPTEAELRVPNNRGGLAPWTAPKKLKVTLVQEPSLWAFPPDTEPATLDIGMTWLESLREGVVGISKGRGDYSIGHREGGLPLWFWW
jgi:hypothetical protein